MTCFYISSFIKVRSAIREINIPQFSRFLSSSPSPPMVESEKRLLSSQFVHVPDMPTNFNHTSMSRSTELAKVLEIPLPQLPKRERIWSGYVNRVSRTCACSSHKVSSQSLHYKRFPRFPVSPLNSPHCHGIELGFQIRVVRYQVLLNIKFH